MANFRLASEKIFAAERKTTAQAKTFVTWPRMAVKTLCFARPRHLAQKSALWQTPKPQGAIASAHFSRIWHICAAKALLSSGPTSRVCVAWQQLCGHIVFGLLSSVVSSPVIQSGSFPLSSHLMNEVVLRTPFDTCSRTFYCCTLSPSLAHSFADRNNFPRKSHPSIESSKHKRAKGA